MIFDKACLDTETLEVGNFLLEDINCSYHYHINLIRSDVNPAIVLTDVLFVPSLTKCLISVSALNDKGCSLTFVNGRCKAYYDNDSRLLFSGTKLHDSRLYKLDFESEDSANLFDYRHDNDRELFHHRMGHCGNHVLNKLSTMSTGVPNFHSSDRPFCVDCPMGKMQRLPKAGPSDHRATQPLQLIHCDLKGPVNPLTPSSPLYLH